MDSIIYGFFLFHVIICIEQNGLAQQQGEDLVDVTLTF